MCSRQRNDASTPSGVFRDEIREPPIVGACPGELLCKRPRLSAEDLAIAFHDVGVGRMILDEAVPVEDFRRDAFFVEKTVSSLRVEEADGCFEGAFRKRGRLLRGTAGRLHEAVKEAGQCIAVTAGRGFRKFGARTCAPISIKLFALVGVEVGCEAGKRWAYVAVARNDEEPIGRLRHTGCSISMNSIKHRQEVTRQSRPWARPNCPGGIPGLFGIKDRRRCASRPDPRISCGARTS